jgi:TRAP transporter 4TM/12TM fusion protein
MIEEVAFPDVIQVTVGAVLVVAVLDATRRMLGNAIPVIAGIFLLYAFFGQYIPMAGHSGYSFERIIGNLAMATEGIYGPVLGVSATYIFLFVLFGAFLEYSGANTFFIDISMAFFGRTRGGPAKVATVASGLFGMVSGSCVANVMAVGPLTIPMMTRLGYPPNFAGGIISVAGTGGQIMPPVMGAAAFIIAETLQTSYLEVCKAAFIPAVLYYMSLWFIIDCRANRTKIRSLEKHEVPDWKKVLAKGFYLAAPVILLVVFLAVLNWSPLKAGLWSIISLIAVAMIRKETRFTVKKLMEAMALGAKSCLTVAIVCAIAGVIIGVLNLTGLSIKFSQLLVTLSMGYTPVLLVLTMIAGLILGMGMTATSVYIVLAVLVAPALVSMGVEPMAAHLFTFYFGILSAITPPVAIASFAAASITKTSPTQVGFEGWKIGCAGFIIPFMFLYSPVLMMKGSVVEILYSLTTASVGVYAMAGAVEGWLAGRAVPALLRVLLFIAAICLIDSGLVTDIVGVGIFAACYSVARFTQWGSAPTAAA